MGLLDVQVEQVERGEGHVARGTHVGVARAVMHLHLGYAREVRIASLAEQIIPDWTR